MKEFLLDFYGYLIFAYSLSLMASYAILMGLAIGSILRIKDSYVAPFFNRLLATSPYTPGVSIVAPAYNEANTIVENVNSLLMQDYPKFEVVIVNDGSTDNTLERLIEAFDLVEVPYAYNEHIATSPFRKFFMSKNPKYKNLKVVDKENGGTKADSMNAGLNAAEYPWFINTDADCTLSPNAIKHCIRPVLENKDMIAVSGIMAISNGCDIEAGQIKEARPPRTPAPLFQTLEYMRSFLIGKMAWSSINAMPNVSGGYGMFKRDIVMAAGGYAHDSFAEDMDMLIRMIKYCCDFGHPYKVVQIPETCCWTEGPPNIVQLQRQRTRWGRGLIQTFWKHRSMIWNKSYKRLGMITLPWMLFFEFLAPVIEAVGMLVFIYLAFTGGVNWTTAIIMFLAIYTFCLMLSLIVILYDFLNGGSYKNKGWYFLIVGAAALEPFLYHPLIVFFSLRGYFNFISRTTAQWGEMTRKKFKKKNNDSAASTPDMAESNTNN